jgi:uncharacterized membrane protein
MAAEDKTETKTTYYLCMALYAVFGLSCVMQFSITAILAATAAMTVALVLASIYRRKTKGTFYETHFQWLVRTFWIGGAVYMPFITVAAAIIMYSEMDQSAMIEAMQNGETDHMALAEILIKANQGVFSMLYLSLFLPFTGWWIYRCVAGVRRLMRKEAMPDPLRWI